MPVVNYNQMRRLSFWSAVGIIIVIAVISFFIFPSESAAPNIINSVAATVLISWWIYSTYIQARGPPRQITVYED